MEIIKMLAKTHCYLNANVPVYVVVHETDNWNKGADAKAHANAMKNGNLDGTVHYYVDDHSIYQTLDHKDGAWAVGDGQGKYGITNRNSINIEICVNQGNDYYKSVANCQWLCAKLLKEMGWDTSRLKRHYDASRKHCPRRILDEGLWPSFVESVKKLMGSNAVNTPAPTATKTQASAFANLSEKDAAAKCLELCRQDAKKSGIFASVSAAQMILESGYVKTELAKNANNCFGMKKELSGNTWPGSSWDGKSVYRKQTGEQKPDGTPYTITADFRKYPCIEDSIADHSAYLLGAMNGNKKRYAGITQATNYKEQITIIKNGGYATDVNYVSKICSIIERFGLNKYDKDTGTDQTETGKLEPCNGFVTVIYTGKDGIDVHTTPAWGNANVDREHGPVGPATKKGVTFTVVGKIMVDGSPMYKLKSGLYITASSKYVKFSREQPQQPVQTAKLPYTVKVTCDVLNVRTGPGTGYTVAGTITDRGVYTITEEKDGKGAKKWGKLKSGAGWIALDFTEKR